MQSQFLPGLDLKLTEAKNILIPAIKSLLNLYKGTTHPNGLKAKDVVETLLVTGKKDLASNCGDI